MLPIRALRTGFPQRIIDPFFVGAAGYSIRKNHMANFAALKEPSDLV